MAIFKVNVKANLDAMAGQSRFTDVRENETKMFRFAPPVTEDGMIFIRTFNHYKLKDQDGRGTALADLSLHGTEETGTNDYIASLSETLMKHGNESEQKVGKLIKGNDRYYAQGFEATRQDDGSFKYSGIKLLSLPKTASQKVMKVMKSQQMVGQPLATDEGQGQILLITRTGTGFATEYEVTQSGLQVSLDEAVPGWQDKLFDPLYDALNLRVIAPDLQKQLAVLTYPNLDWDRLESEFGL